MKAQLFNLAAFIIVFNLIQGCGVPSERTERTQTSGGDVDRYLGFGETGEDPTGVMNAGEEFIYSAGKITGLGLATPAVTGFFKESMETFLTQAGDPRQAAVVGAAIGRLDDAKSTHCEYFRARWRDAAGKIQELNLIPSGQKSECAKGLIGAMQRRIVGGSLVALARVSTGTYAGAAGIGGLAVTRDYVAGCVAGAAGAVSEELEYAYGVPGAACGSVPTNGVQY